MSRILITGAAGFIGYHLSKKLCENGETIIGIDNLNDYYDVNLKIERLSILKKYKEFIFHKGDLSDSDFIESVFMNYHPEYVINLAAQAGVRYSIDNPQSYISSNIIGYYTLLEKCKKYKPKHLIFASSSSVYGNQKKIPFSEDDKTDKPISLYAATKKSNEEIGYAYSKLYNIPMSGLRFFTVYGPFGRPDMAYFKFANCIREGKPIELYNNGNMMRDFTYIDDTVHSIELLIGHIPKKDENNVRFSIYNIGKGKPDKLLDFVDILQKNLGKCSSIVLMPMQSGDVEITYADTTKIENEINYKPQIDLEEGLKKFTEWYKQYSLKPIKH